MILKSMVDFVLQNHGKQKDYFKLICYNYANFLNQNLPEPYEINGVTAHPLNRFVPCDLAGNVLEEPKEVDADNYLQYCELQQEYEQAVERVVFKGLEFEEIIVEEDRLTILWREGSSSIFHDCAIESMVEYDAELTESYTKHMGL